MTSAGWGHPAYNTKTKHENEASVTLDPVVKNRGNKDYNDYL